MSSHSAFLGNLKLAALLTSLALVLGGASVPGPLSTGDSWGHTLLRIHALALKAGGDYSSLAMKRAFGGMDPSMRGVAERHAGFGPALLSLPGAPSDPAAAQPLLEASPVDALRLNASLPFSSEANPAARPFELAPATEDYQRAVHCLTQAVYYEAAYEPADGQAAVAQVVLNRLRHPIYPKTVCGVVFQGSQLSTGCQFTFTCDGSLARVPAEAMWRQAQKVAERALAGYVFKPVGNATHYHAAYVFPYWAPTLSKVAKLGLHIFYRWPAGMGLPSAFVGRYAGGEPRLQGGLLPGETPTATAELAPSEDPVFELAAASATAVHKGIEVASADLQTPSGGPELSVRSLAVQPRPAPPPIAIQYCMSAPGTC